MKCYKCGSELKGEWMFCPDCGARLEEEVSLLDTPKIEDIMADAPNPFETIEEESKPNVSHSHPGKKKPEARVTVTQDRKNTSYVFHEKTSKMYHIDGREAPLPKRTLGVFSIFSMVACSFRFSFY